MKKILMIGTGGTIASMPTSSGLHPQLSTDDLLKYLPDIVKVCEVDSIQVCNIDSTNISPDIWITLVHTIQENYEEYDGFVISHGTDTMAYTAAMLSYLIQNSPKPIVITGAQRPIYMDFTDSKTNLFDSFLYASSDDASGIQIVFHGRVILGTRARKTHSKSLQAFSSINYPYLAAIQDRHIIQYIKQDKFNTPSFYNKLNPKVAIFKLTPGVDSEILSHMLEKNDGLILESYGVGGLPSSPYGYINVIRHWTELGKTIVVTTQVPNEGSDMTIYKVGHKLKKQLNILEAYDMITEALVCKLMWILGQTKNPEEIKRLFHTTISNDILY